MKSFFTLLLFVSLLSTLAANDICGIVLQAGTRTADFALAEHAYLDLEYSTDEAAGVRIYVLPFTAGEPSPSFGVSGSGIFTGSGVTSPFITITAGDLIVDEIRVRITTADQSEILREFFIPVNYHFGENGVHDFSFSADQKIGSFLLGEQVQTSFDYQINHPGGARIFVRPLTNGSLTPGYTASGSALYTGTGSVTANFAINSGTNVRVDQLRVRITNDSQSEILREFFLPVNWYWSTVKVTGFGVPGTNFVANNADKTVNFSYQTTEAAGVRIFPRPMTNGELTPQYAACGSLSFTGAGSGSCNFTITTTNQRVDHIRFRATTLDQSETLLELLYPTELYFGNLRIDRIVTCPPSPARLATGERVNSFFRVNNQENGPARIFTRPITEGELSPDYASSGSPTYGTGAGTGDDYFTINTQGVHVDQMRFRVTNENQTATWADFYLGVDYTFGEAMPVGVASPTAADRIAWSFGPNPLQSEGSLQLTSPDNQRVDVSLTDALGRRVAFWPNRQLAAGQADRLTISTAQQRLSDGLYFIHVRGDGFYVTETIVVSR